MNKVEKNYGIGLSEFTHVFRIFEGLLGCHKEQPDENLPVIYEMIAESFPARGLAIFATAMQMYCSSKLSIKPKPGEYMPPLSFATISACIAEVNAREAERERNERTKDQNSFVVLQPEMSIERANQYLNDLLNGFDTTPETEPIWFLWAQAFRIAYRSGVVFHHVPQHICEKIAAQEQSVMLEKMKTMALTNPELREIVRGWQSELNQGITPAGLVKAASIATIKRIISEII